MPPSKPDTELTRRETDQSLDVERTKADEEIIRRTEAIDATADEVVGRARDRADAVLKQARAQADHVTEREGVSAEAHRVVQTERAQQDSILENEREIADAVVIDERAAKQRALAALMRFERETTDERLNVERQRGDQVLSEKDDFMSMVSHDIRTLLGCIAVAAGLQVKAAASFPDARRSLENAVKIQRYTARINRLLGDLVDIAGIEGGRFSVVPQRSDVAAVIQESIETFQPSAADQRIELRAVINADQTEAAFDRDRLLQVLANLLSNALKFTPEGGRVTVEVTNSAADLRVAVQDSGIGIPSSQLGAIFERFWQVIRDDRRGQGLGLFISRHIVEAHGGRIWAESEQGKGATFIFTLPLLSAR